jgi:hypothetical protein
MEAVLLQRKSIRRESTEKREKSDLILRVEILGKGSHNNESQAEGRQSALDEAIR